MWEDLDASRRLNNFLRHGMTHLRNIKKKQEENQMHGRMCVEYSNNGFDFKTNTERKTPWHTTIISVLSKPLQKTSFQLPLAQHVKYFILLLSSSIFTYLFEFAVLWSFGETKAHYYYIMRIQFETKSFK